MAIKAGKPKVYLKDRILAWRERITRELSRDATGGTSEGNRINVFFDGDEAFDAMIHAIGQAKHYVHLEMPFF